jgi:hypothetical protein
VRVKTVIADGRAGNSGHRQNLLGLISHAPLSVPCAIESRKGNCNALHSLNPFVASGDCGARPRHIADEFGNSGGDLTAGAGG